MHGRVTNSINLIFIASLLLVACGGGSDGTVPNKPIPDSVPPVIKSISPKPGTSISFNSFIIIEFDEEIKQADTNNVTIHIYKNGIRSSANLELVPAEIITDKNTLTIKPRNKLISNSKYQIRVNNFSDTSDNINQNSCQWDFATNTYLGTVSSLSIGECGNESNTNTPDTTSPVVTLITPTGTSVPTTSIISVTFDEPIDTNTIGSGIQLSTMINNAPLLVTTYGYSYLEAENKVVLTPNVSVPLNVNLQYQITVKSGVSGIKDIYGNFLEADVISTFTTLPINTADKIPPTVIIDSPTGLTVPLETDIVIIFSEQMNINSIEPNILLSLKAVGSPNIMNTLYNYSYNDIQNKATYRLKTNKKLILQSQYEIRVTTKVMDKNGNGLTIDEVITFTTIPDLIPPDIINLKVSPAEAALVAPSTQIVIPFNEAMTESTLLPNIMLSTVNAAGVTTATTLLVDNYNFSYNPTTFTVVFTPKQAQTAVLLYDTKYRLTVVGGAVGGANGVKDIHNNALTNNYERNFATILLQDTTRPLVSSVTPTEAAIVSVNTQIVITFSEPMDNNSFASNIQLYEVIAGTPMLLQFPFTIKSTPPFDVVTLIAITSPPLLPGKNYQLVIKGNVTGINSVSDVTGNNLQTDKIINFATSASNEWSWLNGSKDVNVLPVYTGVTQNPGGRKDTVSWVDLDGNFWIFGGKQASYWLNDLWKFDVVTKQWSELSGNITRDLLGKYSVTPKTPSSTIYPGSRSNSSSWVDANGDFWLFGGYGNGTVTSTGKPNIGYFNDIWKYSPKTNQWTWLNGTNTLDSAGSYSTALNQVNKTNSPPARADAQTWVDSEGNFWLFGGDFRGSGRLVNLLSDIWKYLPNDNVWIWMGGSQIQNQYNVYESTLQAPAILTPSSRRGAATWIDRQDQLWLFGGDAISGNAQNNALQISLSDNALWSFNTTTLEWTVYKPAIVSIFGIYGQKTVPNINNRPGHRSDTVFWQDKDFNFWLYGGNGNGASTGFLLNDVWKFDGTNWIWMHGSNEQGQAAIFPTLGTSTSTSTPGKFQNSTGKIDPNGNLLLFGGVNDNGGYPKNDLWKYTP